MRLWGYFFTKTGMSKKVMSSEDEELAAELAKLEAEMNEMENDVSSIEKKDVTPVVQLVPGKKLFVKEATGDELTKGRVVTYNQRVVDYPIPKEWLQRTKEDPMKTTKISIEKGGVGTICWTNVLDQTPEDEKK